MRCGLIKETILRHLIGLQKRTVKGCGLIKETILRHLKKFITITTWSCGLIKETILRHYAHDSLEAQFVVV